MSEHVLMQRQSASPPAPTSRRATQPARQVAPGPTVAPSQAAPARSSGGRAFSLTAIPISPPLTEDAPAPQPSARIAGGPPAVIQRKRLYNEMPFARRGTDSLVWEVAKDTHATVFPDSPNFAGPLGYQYISPRWVSSYHITRDNGRDRAYYDDEGNLIPTRLNRGAYQSLNAEARQYQRAVDKDAKFYSERAAIVKDQELAKAEGEQKQKEEAAAKERNKQRNTVTNHIILGMIEKAGGPLTDNEIAAKWFAFFKENKQKNGREDIDAAKFIARYKHFQQQLGAAKRKGEASPAAQEGEEGEKPAVKKEKIEET
jgi:hypothetical protein